MAEPNKKIKGAIYVRPGKKEMNNELEDKLYEKFHFFDMGRGNIPLECGDGWFQLIMNMCDEILQTKVGEFIFFTQVKEKYGTLRVYTLSSFDEVDDIIDKYERLSATTCEICGNPDSKIRGHGWIMVRCDQCYNAEAQ